MKKTKILPLLIVVLAIFVWLGFGYRAKKPVSNNFLLNKVIDNSGQSSSLDLPEIEPYMLQADGNPANWLGVLLKNKELVEPINIVIVDRLADSQDEAIKNLDMAMEQAGFPGRTGHSTDYQARIDGVSYQQLPEGKHLAYSDAHFEENNNHGRIFGPHFYKNQYIFIGAFSREDAKLNGRNGHSFNSFNRARDQLAKNLDDNGFYKIVEFLQLNNYLINHPSQTTGDHDGMAVVLSN